MLVASCYRPITVYEFLQIKEAYPDQVVLCEVLARFKQNGYAVGRVLESRLLPARLEAVRLSGARETTKDMDSIMCAPLQGVGQGRDGESAIPITLTFSASVPCHPFYSIKCTMGRITQKTVRVRRPLEASRGGC